MTALEKVSSALVWAVALFAIVFLMTPLVVTVAVSFGSSAVFTLPPPDQDLDAGLRKTGDAPVIKVEEVDPTKPL